MGSASPDFIFAYHLIQNKTEVFPSLSHYTKALHLLYLDQTEPTSGPVEWEAIYWMAWASEPVSVAGETELFWLILINQSLLLGQETGSILPKPHSKYWVGGMIPRRKFWCCDNERGKEWMLGKKPPPSMIENKEEKGRAKISGLGGCGRWHP